jgi:two-component system, NtrC family, sensor kinase
MRLSTKISLGAAAILVAVNLAALPVAHWRYQAQLREGLTEAARSYYKLIVIMRGWVAQHGGVLVYQSSGAAPNPYLSTPVIATAAGESLYWRNPALVTRELSELSTAMGDRVRFRVTSLDPMNPVNAPDAFEIDALHTVRRPDWLRRSPYGEVTGFETVGGVRHFRYFAPLYAEETCRSCHNGGYQVGDVRGGISILMPADHLARATTQSYALALLAGALASAATALLIFWLIRSTVIRPLRRLEDAARQIGDGDFDTPIAADAGDEIGDVGRAMSRMQLALRRSVGRLIETEKMAALGHLSAGIAHEIRNPLFAIRNDLDYLRRTGGEDAARAEVYQDMEEGVQRIGRTVNAVLGYARPHAPEHGRHRLAGVLGRCQALLGTQLASESIDLVVELAPDLPAIEMDVHQMEQVFVNLLNNAMRARRGPRGRIVVTARRAGDDITIRVEDDGTGIRAVDLPHIFDPFYTRSIDGTGLGLTIVRRIVNQHHGTIEVESEPGRGTAFTLRLPLRQPRAGQPDAAAGAGRVPGARAAASEPAGASETGSHAVDDTAPSRRQPESV